jgi:hypothetical protein
VDQLDLAQFRSANNSSLGNSVYVAYLDADNSGVIDQIDLGQFRSRNNSNVFPTTPSVGGPDLMHAPGGAPVPQAPAVEQSIAAPLSLVAPTGGALSGSVVGQSTAAPVSAAPAVAISTDSHERTAATPSFTGADTNSINHEIGGIPSLADGQYQSTVLAASVTGTNGLTLTGGGPNGNYVSPIVSFSDEAGQPRLYLPIDDVNRDSVVNQLDLGRFRPANNSSSSNPAYIACLDADNSDSIDQFDLGQFQTRIDSSAFQQ